MFTTLMATVSLLAPVAAADVAPPGTIDISGLLAEMTDRRALAQFPEPEYTCRQFSSYDRRSKTADDPSDDGWFANADAGNYLRIEQQGDRQEAVMMDVAGPGAVVRIWSANPKGTMRIYIDGADEPALEAPMADLLTGRGPVKPPLSAMRSRGTNLYLPIPYQKRCRITTDDWQGVYYQINYRTYPEGTAVESFSTSTLEDAADAIARANDTIASPELAETGGGRGVYASPQTIEPGEEQTLFSDDAGGSIAGLMLDLDAARPEETAQALRSSILQIDFDGERTVECPVGDFFGAAPGGPDDTAYESWPFVINRRGAMISHWFMPYAKSMRISVRNLDDSPVTVGGMIVAKPYEWTDRSMHFNARWRIERDIHTRPRQDWNYVELSGKGVYIGDALFVTNPVEEWWGEGDEKIYIDGEDFPSHFGTGTEDYYGYAWCSPEEFQAPFHAQPRCDGPGNYGNTAVNRFRALDAIPYRESLKVDMEVWHWKECDVTYAVACYWYAVPGGEENFEPIARDMVATIPTAPPLPPPFKVDGALEGEGLEVVHAAAGISIGEQGLWKKGTYSNDAHLWVQARSVSDFVEVRVPTPAGKQGRRHIVVHLTKSWDYGIVQCFVNGQQAGEPIDTFNDSGGAARELGATGPIDLGEFDLGESFILRIEVVGSNEKSERPHFFFGLDCVVVE